MSNQPQGIELSSPGGLKKNASGLKLDPKSTSNTPSAIPIQNAPAPKKNIGCVFFLFLMTNVFLNFDGGVIPASLAEIEKEIHVDYTHEAALGSLAYLGLSTSSLFVSHTYKKFDAKNVLALNLFINALMCFWFSFTYDLLLLYASRIVMGMTQAFCCIYAPVWVNEYSPPNRGATWMGMLQAFSPIGVLVGFMAAAFVNQYTSLSWRFGIQLQGFFLIPIALGFFFMENSKVDVLHSLKYEKAASLNGNGTDREIRMDAVSYDNVEDAWKQVKTIVTNKPLILLTFALTSLYFVVTGIQYWSTLYMIKIINMSQINATTAFGIICFSSPLLGVFVGGLSADSLGGYKGENRINAIKLSAVFSIVASFIAVPLGFVGSPYFFVPLLWTLLFFGASIIPTATGIIVDSVPRELQAATSSISQLLYNIGGFFLAPILSAFIMDRFDNEEAGLTWGSILWVCALGLLLILAAWYNIHLEIGNYAVMKDEHESNLSILSKQEVKIEIARRRAISLL